MNECLLNLPKIRVVLIDRFNYLKCLVLFGRKIARFKVVRINPLQTL